MTPSLEDVYCKFGFVAEAAQPLEPQLCNIVMASRGVEQNWFFEPDCKLTEELLDRINRQTLAQLIKGAKQPLDDLLVKALREPALSHLLS